MKEVSRNGPVPVIESRIASEFGPAIWKMNQSSCVQVAS
jgi:hypothetical protein